MDSTRAEIKHNKTVGDLVSEETAASVRNEALEQIINHVVDTIKRIRGCCLAAAVATTTELCASLAGVVLDGVISLAAAIREVMLDATKQQR